MPPHVLIAGISTRAAAESAACAGFQVTAIDAFADLDQHVGVRSLSLSRDLRLPSTAPAAARAAKTIACDAVAYGSSFENHSRAVRTLAAGRALWGNSPEVLRRVRDPRLLFEVLRRRGLPVPEVKEAIRLKSDPTEVGADRANVEEPSRAVPYVGSGFSRTFDQRQWMLKPLTSGGGHRVRRWRLGTRIPHGCYLQEFVDGISGSVVFVAAGGRAVPLGLSCQLAGDRAFGASGYRYCGNILTAADDPISAAADALVTEASVLAAVVAEEFGLIGVNGIDFVARDGSPVAIEVNPRWSASMELVERAYGISMFGAHAAACAAGTLPVFDLADARRRPGAIGKAVVFARHDLVTGDTRAWLADPDIRDVPHPGERIRSGRPVCTVFADAQHAGACYHALVQRAAQVYAALAIWATPNASSIRPHATVS